jgi:hypothetical protein
MKSVFIVLQLYKYMCKLCESHFRVIAYVRSHNEIDRLVFSVATGNTGVFVGVGSRGFIIKQFGAKQWILFSCGCRTVILAQYFLFGIRKCWRQNI